MAKAKKKTKKKSPLSELVDSTFTGAEELFNEQGGVHSMIFCDFDWVNDSVPQGAIQRKNTGFAIVLGDESSVDARRVIIHAMGCAVAVLQLLQVVGQPQYIRMVSEAWYSEHPKKKKDGTLPLPSQDPNRKEALLVTAMDKDRNGVFRMKQIKRVLHTFWLDKGSVLSESEWKKDDQSESVLDLYWNAYEMMYAKLLKEGGYEQHIQAAQMDPKHIFESTMKMALGAAQVMATEGKETKKK